MPDPVPVAFSAMAREDFLADAKPIIASVVTGGPEAVFVVLVFDDTGEDELVEMIAQASASGSFDSHGMRGEWGQVDDLAGRATRFTLVAPDGLTYRQWFIEDTSDAVVRMLTRDHVVILMPAEITGETVADLQARRPAALAAIANSLPGRMRASLIVRVRYHEAGTSR